MRALSAALVSSGVALAATATPAVANPAGTGLVISEAYVNGGSSGATYTNKFVELYNPTASAIDLAGKSLQYRSPTGTTVSSTAVALTGSIAPGGYFTVQGGSNGSNGVAVPGVDQVATGLNPGAGGGTITLAGVTAAVDPSTSTDVIDKLGWGTSNAPEGTAATGNSVTSSLQRSAQESDTDNNSADFVAAAPTPDAANSGGGGTAPTPVDKTIAEIQGTGTTSPLVGQTVHTTGIVTAKYPAGGLNGIYVQTEGTGGATDATPGASDAVFVFGANSGASTVALGDKVDVTGPVSEFSGTTEITPAAGGVTVSSAAGTPVTPLVTAYPTTEADREAHEGELLAPTDHFTVTNTYSTNQYAEIGLATGDRPLVVPTEVADAQDSAAIADVKADNAARAVTLDDGASINFLSNANKGIPLPWLSPSNPIRVGAPATLKAPVVLEYRNSTWKFQPTTQVTGEGASVASFENTRTAAPETVGGNLHLATFNVLNYFNTVGVDYAATGHTCTYYDDRAGNHVTVNDCGPTGPRGAAEADDLQRQQAKIVAAINRLGADVVSLEEIENSVALGEADRDDALSTLVDALNQAAGSTRWAYAPSPDAADLPPVSEQDVIRTAFIYNPATVSLVGASEVLVGSDAFSNAREPLAQAFKPKGTPDSNAFAVVVNHFKSKGSGTDDGTGQGNANPDRVAQAQALIPFANDFATSRGTDKVILTGDFNSYSMEDPIQVLEGAGYKTVNSDDPNEWTYSFGGQSGSLDHVLANPAAQGMIAGADVWGINSGESVAYEYSRDNYNATDFYAPDQFRASDHDPEIVGLNVDTTPEKVASTVTATASPATVKVKKGTASIAVTVSADGVTPTGTVTALVDGTEVGSAELAGGAATLQVGPFDTVGTKTVEIRYAGDSRATGSSTSTTVEVTKARPKMSTELSPARIVAGRTRALLEVTVHAAGAPATGWVRVGLPGGRDDLVVKLDGGDASVRLPVFNRAGDRSVYLHYNGNATTEAADAVRLVRVVKR